MFAFSTSCVVATTLLLNVQISSAAFADRVNVTDAIQMFMITECSVCVTDKNSIFCTSSSGADSDSYVSNSTLKYTVAMKKHDFGDDLGAKYCWAGTFGALTHNTGNYDELEGSRNVTVNLGCPLNNLFYRQCIIPLQMAIILIAVGGFVFLCGTTCICFVCGCCKCCNRPGDESKWGMCNRFCPWMPCADPQKKDDAPASWQHNPVTEEENKSSLFGRNPAFKPSGSETGIAMTAQKAPLAGSKV